MDLNGVRTATCISSVCLGSVVFLHIIKIKLTLKCSQSKHIVIFDTLISQSPASDVEAVPAHELGHWYYLHTTKLMIVSQLHAFSVLAGFPGFLHAPPLLRSFDFPKHIAAKPPTLIAFMLFQVPRFVFRFQLLPHKHVDIRYRQMTLTFSSKFL